MLHKWTIEQMTNSLFFKNVQKSFLRLFLCAVKETYILFLHIGQKIEPKAFFANFSNSLPDNLLFRFSVSGNFVVFKKSKPVSNMLHVVEAT